jgi:hypothetical protein
MKNTYRILVGKPEERSSPNKPIRRSEDTVKINLK